jgi:hypothetical protein
MLSCKFTTCSGHKQGHDDFRRLLYSTVVLCGQSSEYACSSLNELLLSKHNRFGLHIWDHELLSILMVKSENTELLHYLTNAMDVSRCSATQEIPSILRNPKVHYRLYNNPPLVPVLSQMNPVHSLLTHLFTIHFNITLSTFS